MAFRVGQKVVCVDENWLEIPYDWERMPRKGEIYTIREIVYRGGDTGLRFVEIVNPIFGYDGGRQEVGFLSTHFRPLVDLSDLESIVTEVMRGKPRKIKSDQFDKQRVHSSAVPSQASRRRAATVPDAAAGRALPSMVLPAPLPSWRVSEHPSLPETAAGAR